MVGVGQFARGVARRNQAGRRTHGVRRVRAVVGGLLVAVVLVLWIIARLAGHL
jgi:hypothetical protein